MDKMKQTAVEWLEHELIALQNYGVNELGLIEKAKAMEKDQIMDSHNQGYADGYRDNGNSPIEYYNETFKKK